MQSHYTVSNLIDAKNLKQLSVIGTIPNENLIYFFCREEKILFPINVENLDIDVSIANYDANKLIISVSKFFHAEVEKIIISWKDESTYLTYVRIRKNKNYYDFILNLENALQFGLRFNVPIFISTQLLFAEGIKITKEMLENYLK